MTAETQSANKNMKQNMGRRLYIQRGGMALFYILFRAAVALVVGVCNKATLSYYWMMKMPNLLMDVR